MKSLPAPGWHDDGKEMCLVSKPVNIERLRRDFVEGDEIGPCEHGRDPYTRCFVCDLAVDELRRRDAEKR